MAASGFVWILLAGAVYGALHTLIASNHMKAWAQRIVGVNVYRRGYRLFFSIVGGITLLPVLALLAFLPDTLIYTIPSPWRWITLSVQAAALFGMAISVMQTGALRFIGLPQLLDTKSTANSAQPEVLITGGLYAYMRHPIYFFSLILLWLVPGLTWNLLAMNLAFSAYFLIGAYLFEEPKLIEQFGSAYVTYRRRTPMIFPKLNGIPLFKRNP